MSSAEARRARGLPVGWALAWGLGLCVLAFAAVLSFVHGPWRGGLACGVVTGALGGVLGLWLVGRTLDRPINAAVAAMGLSFVARVLLVGAGVAVTLRALHADPLGFVAAFFPLFFAFVGLEFLVLRARSTDQGPTDASGSPHHA